MSNSNMVSKKSWNEFRETGLFAFMNSILHAFGWAIVVEVDDGGKLTNVFPARVKYRGFSEDVTDEYHKKIGRYLAENASELREEAES